LKKTFYILSFLIFGICNSQENSSSDCQLQEENKLWIAKFSNTDSKEKRIELIKNKIISDSVYSYKQPTLVSSHGRFNSHEDNNGKDCGCKITFFLTYSSTRKTIELNLNLYPEQTVIVDSLNPNNIRRIFYEFDNKKRKGKRKENCGVVKLRME
jgi:hypothetical protein